MRTLLSLTCALGFVLSLGCSKSDEEEGDSCVVESTNGVSYCVNEFSRSTCQEHGLLLWSGSLAKYEPRDCRDQGFTQSCDFAEIDVYVTLEDDCAGIDEPWVTQGAGGAGGAGD